MKRLIVTLATVAALAVAAPSFAQTNAPSPEVAAYQQLLTEANDRVVKLSAQLHQAVTELTKLRAEREKAATPSGPK